MDLLLYFIILIIYIYNNPLNNDKKSSSMLSISVKSISLYNTLCNNSFIGTAWNGVVPVYNSYNTQPND